MESLPPLDLLLQVEPVRFKTGTTLFSKYSFFLSSGGGGGGLVDTVLDTVAGLIAGATLPNQANNGKTLDKPDGKSLPQSDRTGAS